jgi:hypothetical protein
METESDSLYLDECAVDLKASSKAAERFVVVARVVFALLYASRVPARGSST